MSRSRKDQKRNPMRRRRRRRNARKSRIKRKRRITYGVRKRSKH